MAATPNGVETRSLVGRFATDARRHPVVRPAQLLVTARSRGGVHPSGNPRIRTLDVIDSFRDESGAMLKSLISQSAPAFVLAAVSINSPEPHIVASSDCTGHWLLLLFYPRDF